VSPGDWYPMFWGTIVVSSAEVACPTLVFNGHLTLDDGDHYTVLNFQHQSASGKEQQYPTRTDNSNVTTLCNDGD